MADALHTYHAIGANMNVDGRALQELYNQIDVIEAAIRKLKDYKTDLRYRRQQRKLIEIGTQILEERQAEIEKKELDIFNLKNGIHARTNPRIFSSKESQLYLMEWKRGATFNREVEVIWESEDKRFIVIKAAGGRTYIKDKMEKAHVELWLVDTRKQGTYVDNYFVKHWTDGLARWGKPRRREVSGIVMVMTARTQYELGRTAAI